MSSQEPQQGPLSPDGQWRWDGTQWVPAVPPPWPANPQPPGANPIYPAQPARAGGIVYQFSGDALWSIILGLVSVIVPLVSRFYFPILPLFGIWRGILAVRSGRIAGGVIGLVINVVGVLVSLLASGLIFR